ncbi:MAG: FAD-binding oxidoreductase [Fodinibius sp.]|nr:FAD-binding oxidoreductase [Fodinibius sp.]
MILNDDDARVQPGATLADFDRETQKYGLATPTGINSTTGISGLTLGGGFGWLTRKYGLTIDNLASAQLVTADGKQLQLSNRENSDLFWAIRGGGGNFGVITEYEFKLHPVGPEVLAGLMVYPFIEVNTIFAKVTANWWIRMSEVFNISGNFAEGPATALPAQRGARQTGCCPCAVL